MTVVNTSPPTINGLARQGTTLTGSNGSWTWDEVNYYLTFAYQWERCDAAGANCVDIVGATSNQYTLTAADVGHRIRLEVTATEEALPGPGPPPGGYYDTINELTSVFLPINTYPANITQGVTNPPGRGGGIWEISDGAGSGFRMVATPQMPAPWQGSKKVCFAQLLIRTAVGLYEEWSFKYRYPSADNPAFPTLFQAGTVFEFGHHQNNSGVYIGVDARAGGEGHHVGVPTSSFSEGGFNFYTICSFPTFLSQLDHDYVVQARLRYNPDGTGYVRIIIDGVTIVDQSRPMRPNTSEIPKPQPGWYSDLGSTKNGVELRNIAYDYNVP